MCSGVFRWVECQFKPLVAEELIDAMAVELGDNAQLDRKRRVQDASNILGICPDFIEVDISEDPRFLHFPWHSHDPLKSVSRLPTSNWSVLSNKIAQLYQLSHQYLLPKSLNQTMLRVDTLVHVNALGRFGSALHVASAYDQQEIVQMLLDNGADVNSGQGSFGTALQEASLHGHKEVVQMLLDD
ncbi:hypothetical protein VTN00DRAFT_6688 [Thermoascus crustaceus]|uniref:uncharacterized protein n=1 Tax=Thermoascus crustaceus TaxID=5088 RepID=UPI0037423E96